MPQLDVSTFLPQLFWLIISFLALYYILNKFCLPKLYNIFHERDMSISHALAKANKNKQEADRLKSEYEELLKQALKTKDSIISEALKETSKMMDHKMSEHELELKIIESNSKQRLKNFQDESADDIKKIAKEATAEILLNLLNTKVDRDLISRTVEAQSGVNHGI